MFRWFFQILRHAFLGSLLSTCTIVCGFYMFLCLLPDIRNRKKRVFERIAYVTSIWFCHLNGHILSSKFSNRPWHFFWCFPKSFRQPTFGVRGNVVYPEDIWNGGPMPESKQIATSVISSLISCRVISDVMKVRSQCLIIFRTVGFMGLLSESNYIHLPGHRHQRWSLVQGEAKPQKTISQYFRLVKDHDSDNKLPGLPNYEQY